MNKLKTIKSYAKILWSLKESNPISTFSERRRRPRKLRSSRHWGYPQFHFTTFFILDERHLWEKCLEESIEIKL